ncbi:hypothetical protein D3C87_1596600 [compost metagenome]
MDTNHTRWAFAEQVNLLPLFYLFPRILKPGAKLRISCLLPTPRNLQLPQAGKRGIDAHAPVHRIALVKVEDGLHRIAEDPTG